MQTATPLFISATPRPWSQSPGAAASSSATPGVDEAFVLDKHKGTATSAVAEGHIGWYVVDAAGTANDRTFIRVNYNADATIEMTIELQGAMKLTNVDFIL